MADVTILKDDKTKKGDMDALASMFNTSISTVGDVIKSLLQASMSNPLMGITASFVSVAIFHKAGLLSDQEFTNIKIVILAAAGITITTDIVKAIEELVPWSAISQIGQKTPTLTQPSGTVLVFGNDTAQLNALLSKIGVK